MPKKPVEPEKRKGYDGKETPIFSIKIRERRLSMNLKQSDVADRCGIKQKEVSAIEGGRFANDCNRIIALARALETTPDYLFGFREEP